MGYATALGCHADLVSAAAAYCSEVHGVTASGVVSCPGVVSTAVSGDLGVVGYALRVVALDGTPPATEPTVYASLQQCEQRPWELSLADGVELSWLVAGVLVVAWGFRMLALHLKWVEPPAD